MFTAFLALQRPDSTSAKPRFMKKTRKAVRRTHIVSIETFVLSMVGALVVCAKAGDEKTKSAMRANVAQFIGFFRNIFQLLEVFLTEFRERNAKTCAPCRLHSELRCLPESKTLFRLRRRRVAGASILRR